VTEDRPQEIPELPREHDPIRDGIGEEDNPVPLWFNLGFYGLIVVGIFYSIYYTTSGWSSLGEYEAQVAAADALAEQVRASRPQTNPFRGDAAAIQEGAQVFASICATCHKPDGSGLVGPSLVDPYWKYGNDDQALFTSVSEGRPGGMPPWGAVLGDEKIWKALAYLETLPKSSEPGIGAPGFDTANTGGAGS
jgi:cytochrome c oxidase cbb3-type subunit 3